jgi:hypothetical protein
MMVSHNPNGPTSRNMPAIIRASGMVDEVNDAERRCHQRRR